MRVLIFGAGAMACLAGARLAKVADVTLVDSWREGIDSIRNHGIWVEDGNVRSRVVVGAEYLGVPLEPFDLALVLVKSWQTASISPYVDAYVLPDGILVSLQNGLGNLELLGSRASAGVTAMGATLLEAGRVRVCGSGPTHLATPEWVADLFRQAGFESYSCEPGQAESLLWGKLCVNCGINALTALLRVPNGGLLRNPAAAELMEQAVLECAAVARAESIALPFADAVEYARNVAERTASNLSSMLQDVLRGAPTECDAINGAVVREGKRFGIPTPVNAALWKLVTAMVLRQRDDSCGPSIPWAN